MANVRRLVRKDESTATESVSKSSRIPFSLGMVLVTLGVVYGDIGTSPMYVMKSVVAGNGGMASTSEEMILGALSLVIWTMTLVTTIKYVVIAMRADNHGEGGIFALYSLVKDKARWLIIPAMIGGSALLADGMLTPAVTVTTAIEGLRTIDLGYKLIGENQMRVVAITIAIICALYFVQKAGTSSVGKAFGPVMTLWFAFLGVAGLLNMLSNPGIFRALNPVRGLMFLFGPANKAGLMVLHFVFLATTGAEALYSDMGHVGKANIYASWPFVKACLILNYLGQGAWIITNAQNAQFAGVEVNPFFEMLPEEIRPFSVLLSTVAAIIASQALITGSFTLVSEAIRLNLMPHLHISYPSENKGQLYIPLVNSALWIGTLSVVLLFRTSSRMEAAYGLAITLTMIMTTILLISYIATILNRRIGAVVFGLVFGAIELCFLLACMTLFLEGGYVMIIVSGLLFYVMFVWRRGTAIERSQAILLPVRDYVDQLSRLRDDQHYSLLTDNLVYLTNNPSLDELDRDVLYSILNKQPKRAKAYWFVNVQVTDEPYTHAYVVNNFGTDFVFKVQMQLGFRVNQRVNSYIRQVVTDLVESGELAEQVHDYSIYSEPSPVGDFSFAMIRKKLAPDTDLSARDRRVISTKYAIRGVCGSPTQWYGLESSNVILEYVPMFTKIKKPPKLVRKPLSYAIVTGEQDVSEDIFSGQAGEREEPQLLEACDYPPKEAADSLQQR